MSNEIARVLFGDEPPAAESTPRALTPREETASRFYDGAAADAAAGGELYTPNTFLKGRFESHRAELADIGLTSDQIAESEQSFCEVTRELDLNWADAERLYDVCTTARIAATRDATMPGPHTLVFTEEARRTLREQYGAGRRTA